MIGQSKAFVRFALGTMAVVSKRDYDIVVASSARLMTAALGSLISWYKRLPLYLDIRDIFLDVIEDLMEGRKAKIVTSIFSKIEAVTLRRADRVNLVSEGFGPYFLGKYPKLNYSFHSNGVDDEFIVASNPGADDQRVHPTKCAESADQIEILYAGNIGAGQGLHTVIPRMAVLLRGQARITIIGDGGNKSALIKKLKEANVADLVHLERPMRREELIRRYCEADVLFLHLNKHKAFEKVLPSKIFEYAALGKPILAGVAGYPAEFLAKQVENAGVFKPGDAEAAIESFKALKLETTQRTDFIRRYSRRAISKRIAEDVFALVKTAKN
jgi:glycosyltransferase involved in cell wall biosynthesis